MKLIFSDVDNTLVSKGEKLSPQIKEAINTVIQNEDQFVLCSGRPVENIIAIGEELRNENIMVRYAAGYNGGKIYDFHKQEFVVENGFSAPQVENIASELDSLDVKYLMYSDRGIESPFPDNEYVAHEKMLTDLPINECQESIPSAKVLGLIDPKRMSHVLPQVQDTLTNCTVNNSTPFYIEITPKGVDKGYGLKKMQELLKVSDENVYCFGDALNDYPMFMQCNNAYCVDNAVDEIKAVAKGVIPSVSDFGVAHFINELYNQE